MLRRVSSVAALLAVTALAAPTAAGAASAGGHSNDAIVVISGDVFVHRGETVSGVFIANGDARIAGHVDGDVIVLSGDVLVSGTIDGDLFTASGEARLLPTAEVTGDVGYSDEHPQVALDARVHGDVTRQSWPDVGGLVSWIGGFLVWLAVSLSALVLGALLLLIAPRAGDSLEARSRQKIGPTIAIGIAILIVLPLTAFLAAITVFGLPLALGIALSLLPIGAVAYVAAAYAVGRRVLKPPRERMLSFLVGLAILRVAALVPFLGLLVGLAALVFGLGLIGAAIGAAREPSGPAPARSPGS
ncbi:MAG TPA: polymer-forming cytoskeletal protein [Solirubrobacterales bacterium]|nr:polymer-forming cytoskeletal protein [Solirubrobacterales bacterium]